MKSTIEIEFGAVPCAGHGKEVVHHPMIRVKAGQHGTIEFIAHETNVAPELSREMSVAVEKIFMAVYQGGDLEVVPDDPNAN